MSLAHDEALGPVRLTQMHWQTSIFTLLALVAFAANSVLCRNALATEAIDPGTFTIIRLSSGALVLILLWFARGHRKSSPARGSWRGASALFVYAISFSYAYISLDTGTGALILFAAVQFTIMGVNLWQGAQYSPLEFMGIGLAFLGFILLVVPELNTPSISGFILMTLAGIAWGAYTLYGQHSRDALADTACNFLRTLPMVLVLLALIYPQANATLSGVALAISSGALASGIGYALWYAALPRLALILAALLQLAVPILASIGGVIVSAESITRDLIISSALVLGGLALVITSQKRQSS